MLKYTGVLLICMVTVTVCRPGPLCAWMCGAVARPVCGTNGRTYRNICELYRANCKGESVKFEYEGICKKRCPKFVCPDYSDLLCGSNGVTYKNRCYLHWATICIRPDIRIRHRGKC